MRDLRPAETTGADAPPAAVSHAGPAPAGGVLERMPAAFALLDQQGRFRYVNAAAENLLGRQRAELLGRRAGCAAGPLAPLFARTHRPAAHGHERDSGGPVDELPVGERWYEVRAWPEPDGLAVYVLDVTDRRRAEEAARRSGERTALLTRLSADLGGAVDAESALGRLPRLVVPTLTDGCIVTVVDRDGRARDVASWHRDPGRRRLLDSYTSVRLDTMPPGSPVARALELGTAVTESVAAVVDLMGPSGSADLLRAIGAESVAVLPLPSEARTVGVLTLYLDPGRTFGEEDLRIAQEVAGHAGRAVERVHRHSRQVELAEGLQRSLLTDPPALPGADVVVRYVPAAEAARVGGDWYDAFLLRDGTPMVVIGDVAGHDTAAAAAMGQLRGLLRGVAHAGGGGPADVLRAFDEAVVAMHPETLATAAVARIEHAARLPAVLRWASAGHPPPVVVDAAGSVRLLGEGTGDLLLGVDPTVRRAESTLELGPGDTVLLYTDGLIERRDAVLDEGLDRLVRALGELADLPLGPLCDTLLDRMLRGTPEDDVALVAVRVRPPTG